MRRRVDASRVRNPVPVSSWPRWSRRIPTGIAHGIGHGHARVFMEFHWQQGGYSSWRIPHRTPILDRIGARGVASEEDTVYLCASRTSPAAFPNPLGCRSCGHVAQESSKVEPTTARQARPITSGAARDSAARHRDPRDEASRSAVARR